MTIETLETKTPKAARTQRLLLDAGIEAFASDGFEATGLRTVEESAGVQRNLITYHFGSKELFWKHCVAALFERARIDLPDEPRAEQVGPGEQLRQVVRRYVHMSAEYPELACIMLDEGRRDEWRLNWIVENHIRGLYNSIVAAFEVAESQGHAPPISARQFYYLMIGGAAMFAMRPECLMLSGEDPCAAALVDEHAEMMAALLTSGLRYD